MTEQATAAKRPRRPASEPRPTQEMRSATTRKKLIEAAIECLDERGYFATSTTDVSVRAGVTRGAMYHQFNSKAELMLAVLDYVLEQDQAFYEKRLGDVPPGRERSLALSDAGWEAISGPGGSAVLQIFLSGPGDPDLRAHLPAAQQKLSEGVWRGRRERSRDPLLQEAAMFLHTAAFRGLALELKAGADPAKVKRALALLKRYQEFYLDILWPRKHGDGAIPEAPSLSAAPPVQRDASGKRD